MNFLLITVVEGEGIEALTEIEENIRVAQAAVNVEEEEFRKLCRIVIAS